MERERGWTPGRFYRLPREQQIKLMAHWRIRHEPPKAKPKQPPKRGR